MAAVVTVIAWTQATLKKAWPFLTFGETAPQTGSLG
jgi:hypothetical protein